MKSFKQYLNESNFEDRLRIRGLNKKIQKALVKRSEAAKRANSGCSGKYDVKNDRWIYAKNEQGVRAKKFKKKYGYEAWDAWYGVDLSDKRRSKGLGKKIRRMDLPHKRGEMIFNPVTKNKLRGASGYNTRSWGWPQTGGEKNYYKIDFQANDDRFEKLMKNPKPVKIKAGLKSDKNTEIINTSIMLSKLMLRAKPSKAPIEARDKYSRIVKK